MVSSNRAPRASHSMLYSAFPLEESGVDRLASFPLSVLRGCWTFIFVRPLLVRGALSSFIFICGAIWGSTLCMCCPGVASGGGLRWNTVVLGRCC